LTFDVQRVLDRQKRKEARKRQRENVSDLQKRAETLSSLPLPAFLRSLPDTCTLEQARYFAHKFYPTVTSEGITAAIDRVGRWKPPPDQAALELSKPTGISQRGKE